jgi:hypothetical protein
MPSAALNPMPRNFRATRRQQSVTDEYLEEGQYSRL